MAKSKFRITKRAGDNTAGKIVRKKPFTKEERERVLDYIADFNKPEIWDLLKQNELDDEVQRNASKKELKEFLKSALADKQLQYEALVAYLDKTQPWSRQHVFLYDGPKAVNVWRSRQHLEAVLEKQSLMHALGNEIALILPETLTISTIQHDENRLRIMAVRRREARERDTEDDYTGKNEEGDEVEFKAYLKIVVRGLVMFDWDLKANVASIHITQLPGGGDYEEIEKEFWDLTKDWLKSDWFKKLGLSPAISSLHRVEEKAARSGEGRRFRSHGISYEIQNRRLKGTCGVAGEHLIVDHVVGDNDVINESLTNAREQGGVGRDGNYFWAPAEETPFADEVHFVLQGPDKRINFPTDHDEEVIKYVLARVREACKA